MANDYPLNLERQQEIIFERVINKIARVTLPKYIRLYKREAKNTGLQVDIDEFGSLEIELQIFIATLFQATSIQRDIKRTALLIDAWARAKTTKHLSKIANFGFQDGGILFAADDPLILDFVESYTKFNAELVQSLGREYISEIGKLAQETFVNGGSVSELKDKFTAYTEGEINKAKFWARDQVGDAYSHFTKERQLQAGVQKYIWRTVGDSHVRGLKKTDKTSHVILEGVKFNWKSGAASTGQLSKPGAKHPGEDYNDRCSAEPYLEGFSKAKPDETV